MLIKLKVGEKAVVTVENVINDCIVVSLVVGNRKFTGALLDITKKNGPYGIADVKKSEVNMKDNARTKLSHKTPFPQPLLTRSSYKQDVPQPPLRNIFRRIRRSRRNTKLNMVPLFNGDLLKLKQGKLNKNNAEKSNSEVVKDLKLNLFDKKEKLPSKRKVINTDTQPAKKKKTNFLNESPSTSDGDHENCDDKKILPEKIASPLKNLIPRKADLCEGILHRSPAIRIKYKSPAGRGRVLNIPSKVHSPLTTFEHSSKSKIAIVPSSDKSKIKRFQTGGKGNQTNVSSKSPSQTNKSLKTFGKDKKSNLLTKITDVKVKTFPKEGNSRKNVSNNFLVIVNEDSESNKKKTCLKSSGYPLRQTKKVKDNPLKKNSESKKHDDLSSPIAAVKSRHLRVVLQPLEKSPSDTSTNSPIKDYLKSNKEISKSNDSPSNEKTPSSGKTSRKTPPKKSLVPCSHTIYVTTCKDINGFIFAQGDVVWGKLSGYPWWPSRVIKLIVTKTDGKVLQQEAMVGWFRSSTTSIIPLGSVQPFQKKFDIRFEKKRKGIYQRAVNDAQAAIKEISPEVRKLISQFET